MRWHCYAQHWEDIESATVEAPDVMSAAVLAAEQTGCPGRWTVVEVGVRGVVRVDVRSQPQYEAESMEVV